jgi:hypothetical protein
MPYIIATVMAIQFFRLHAVIYLEPFCALVD